MGGFHRAADIQKMTLLQHFQMPASWAEFTETHGLRGAVPAHTVRYGYYSVIIRAAVAGLGVALPRAATWRRSWPRARWSTRSDLGFASATGCWLTLARDKPHRPGLDGAGRLAARGSGDLRTRDARG